MIWDIPQRNASGRPAVYLTFDDGPNPLATPFVLQQLEQYQAKATFFCVGNNVHLHKALYQQVLDRGHATANHTYDHVNGWKTGNDLYLKNIEQAKDVIQSRAFRPPYGRIRISQIRKLLRTDPMWKIYMWDVLSADFDKNISAEQCLHNVLDNIEPGSIILFHDSEKAWERMSYALPRVLAYCQSQNWDMKVLPC